MNTDELTHALMRMDRPESWHLKPQNDPALLRVSGSVGLVRGTLDAKGFSADVVGEEEHWHLLKVGQ